MSALNVFRSLRAWFQPFIDAIFGRNITFAQRWRMLLFLQPATFITHPIAALPWVFTRAFHAEYITVAPGRKIRVLVFERKDERKAARNGNKLRPLHLSIHGGGFIGGIPEMCAPFCDPLARETGAVVIAPTYRFAPRYGFPTLIDDIDTVVQYLYQNAAERWGADPELMTISGLSAGGNLAMAATQGEGAHQPAKTALKGIVTFYAVVGSSGIFKSRGSSY
jgi:acetyl esterase/lipase